MKNLVIITCCMLLFVGCDKDKNNLSPANGSYPVNITYHYSPYRPLPYDSTLKDFDTSYVGQIVIAGNKDTIQVTTEPIDLYGGEFHFWGKLYLVSDTADTMKYIQTYPVSPGTTRYSLDMKTLYFSKSSHKIYYVINYESAQDGRYTYKLSQQ